MAIYSIADLHLSNGQKPMDVFGPHWAQHFERIQEDWASTVSDDDAVLIPGDISWAMKLEDALYDLSRIGALPGLKVMIKGNHDYWWSSITRVRNALPQRVFVIQNDSLELGGVLVAGTRGWMLPEDAPDAEDVRIYERELLRLEMSLRSARERSKTLPLICMIHFPPLTQQHMDTGFTRLFEAYGAAHVVYGHLHGEQAIASAFKGEKDGVTYHQVSCDGLNFRLYRLI